MRPQDFYEARKLFNRTQEQIDYNNTYRKKHPEYRQFFLSEKLWYKVYKKNEYLDWAIIEEDEDKCFIYFINVDGRVFDRVIVANSKVAKKILRGNGFKYKAKNKMPYSPIEPVFVCLQRGKKTAYYSKGKKLILDKILYTKCKAILTKFIQKVNKKIKRFSEF